MLNNKWAIIAEQYNMAANLYKPKLFGIAHFSLNNNAGLNYFNLFTELIYSSFSGLISEAAW